MLWRVLARFFILDFAQSWDTMYDYLFVSYTACVTRSVEYQERTTEKNKTRCRNAQNLKQTGGKGISVRV